MKLTKDMTDKIMNLMCDYCLNPAKFLPSSSSIYNGRDYGPVYFCAPCYAWVGCHPKSKKPLGRLANAELRKLKMQTHAAFDPIWKKRFERKHKINANYTKSMARGGRYKALSILMNIPQAECHIGMFDPERCKLAIKLCKSGALETYENQSNRPKRERCNKIADDVCIDSSKFALIFTDTSSQS